MKKSDAEKAAAFIMSVWQRSPSTGYGSIQNKTTTGMEAQYFPLPTTKQRIRTHLQAIPRGHDIYFCPLPSIDRRRKKTSFKRSRLLWADLDEASPKCKPRPTIAWETSPGRYQALWFLEKSLPVSKIEIINKNLSYHLGADKGGWDLGQILRVPYTINYKPKYDRPTVTLLWNTERVLKLQGLKKFYKKLAPKPKQTSIISPPLQISKVLTDQWLHWENISEGERSEKPHKWVWAFLSKGLSEEWVLRAVSEHPLTQAKYGDRAETEVQRSMDKWEEKAPQQGIQEWTAPQVTTAIEFLATQPEVRWMAKDIWMEGTVGMFSGPPKVFKSWLSLDLIVSIASRTAFMGNPKFKWGEPQDDRHNVLMIQEEDPHIVLASRLGRILTSRGFDAGGYKESKAKITGHSLTLKVSDPVPIYIVNASGFSLNSPDYIEWLEETIDELRPRLVVLDPLIVMLGSIDEFKAGEVTGLLRPIKLLRDRYDCSFCIVHHTHRISTKGAAQRAGEELYASIAFHAWLESAIHIRPVGDIDETRTVELKREFKAAAFSEKLYVHFPNMDKEYHPELKSHKEVQETTAKRKESKRGETQSAKLDEDVARVYTLVKQEGPISGQEIQSQLEWGKQKRMKIVKETVGRGHIIYESSSTGRSAKLVLSE